MHEFEVGESSYCSVLRGESWLVECLLPVTFGLPDPTSQHSINLGKKCALSIHVKQPGLVVLVAITCELIFIIVHVYFFDRIP